MSSFHHIVPDTVRCTTPVYFDMVEALNRCLNNIDRLCALHMTHPDPFQEFSDFEPPYRGVTGVICGDDLAQNGHFLEIYPLGSV